MLYRDEDLKKELEQASKILVIVNAADGAVAESLLFKGVGDMNKWFHSDNLLGNLNWRFWSDEHFKKESLYAFSIEHQKRTRRLMAIQHEIGGYYCEKETFYLVVSCPRLILDISFTGSSKPCPWEKEGTYAGLCHILYTPDNKAHNFGKDHMRASSIDIYIK